MENFVLDKDIRLCCLRAASFPDGILAAHQQLHASLSFKNGRMFFGLSRPEEGVIIYNAAAELLAGETAEDFGAVSFTLEKGEYTSIVIKNYMKDTPSIGRAFEKLLLNPLIDPNGYCVEMYLGMNDVRCMVRLIN
jgi:hypothetical protein